MKNEIESITKYLKEVKYNLRNIQGEIHWVGYHLKLIRGLYNAAEEAYHSEVVAPYEGDRFPEFLRESLDLGDTTLEEYKKDWIDSRINEWMKEDE